MPSEAKPLFRADALRPRLIGFALPPGTAEARKKLAHWGELLATKKAEALKETELLPLFLTDLFEGLLGFTGPASGAPTYTLKREALIQVDGKYADAALGRFAIGADQTEFIAVVEGKGPRDPLDRPFAGRKLSAVDQALRYAVNLRCDWYLVTNLREIRVFHKGHDQFTYECFKTPELIENDTALRKFVFLLGAERLAPAKGRCHLDDLLADSQRIGLDLTRDYYREYSHLRREMFNLLRLCNKDIPSAALLGATQKILDRVLFIAFCEDRGLLPAESISQAYRHADPYNPRPIWDNFRGLFKAIDRGSPPLKIEQYNGGLFAHDELLDRLQVPDEVCKGLDRLAAYEYRPPVLGDEIAPGKAPKFIDVEILGHIFEQSITDLEQLHQEIARGPQAEPAKEAPSRRKKEGAFYTPAFITRYIVSATLKPVLEERFEALRRQHQEKAAVAVAKVLADPSAYDVAGLKAAQKKALELFWGAWQEVLAGLRIVDPACGSGAFLIEAFEQLHAVYQQSHARLTELRGPQLFDVDRQILQSNLFGVDLNPEAVEICRLSLWIKTAQMGRVLTSLDHNVLVGNSVVADPAVHPQALDWQTVFPEVFAAGGFDVVICNPPYVRQEWIAPYKPYLEKHYMAYDGVADLYVYFYELGLNVLKPGGRLGFVVTNKWMKAGYGEALRRFFGESAWVESVVDFGHAKQIFPDADVFPSILVARKPTVKPPPLAARVCAIPRDQLRIDDLWEQIKTEGFEVPRARLGPNPWTLEPPGVVRLMEKIHRVGVSLKDFARTGSIYGIKTGLNEAFIVDGDVRERLIQEHPSSKKLLKKYLRGQDIDRWRSVWSGLWMIFARRGINIEEFPAIKRHLESFRSQLEPKPHDWVGGGKWQGRKPGSYKWFEIQDSIDYWQEFDKPKVFYQEIQFHPCYSFDNAGMLANNKAFFIPTGDLYILGVLNSPMLWWHNWRYLPHMKDEALNPAGFLMDGLPIADPSETIRAGVELAVQQLIDITGKQNEGCRALLDWLRLEFEVEKPSQKLQEVTSLDVDGLHGEVKKACGKKRRLSVADLKRLKEEHAASIVPLQVLAKEARKLERQVAELVNAAYGLTAEEVELMWRTAPPRMPGKRDG